MFDSELQAQANALSQSIHGKSILPSYQPPGRYTGELFGVEYLYRQSGIQFITDDIATQIDEGIEDCEGDDCLEQPQTPTGDVAEDPMTVARPSQSESESDEEEEVRFSCVTFTLSIFTYYNIISSAQEGMEVDTGVEDSRGIPGWDKVDALAVALTEPKGLSVTTAQAERIVELYDNLLEYDKRPVRFHQRLQQRPLRGPFVRCRQYGSGRVSLEKMKRFV